MCSVVVENGKWELRHEKILLDYIEFLRTAQAHKLLNMSYMGKERKKGRVEKLCINGWLVFMEKIA